jgi:Tol biopolymer transport system component
MKSSLLLLSTLSLGVLVLLAATPQQKAPATTPAAQTEKHLRNIRQLTFGGQNAEAYFSADGQKLIFQSTRDPLQCDQIFVMNTDGSDQHMVSNGKGRTTCSYFYPDGKKILYSSTHLGSVACPPKPDYSKGYVWAIYPSYDIFTANPDGSDIKQLTKEPGYDAEAIISADGKKIVFTSIRDGDLDIYTMNADGSNVKQLTHQLGYDGGPTFSPDGQMIVYRAHHPKSGQETTDYKDLLKQNLIRPTYLEIWVMKADGSDQRRVTDLGSASFAPAFYPDGRHIIFASNVGSTGGMGNFELYGIDLDGKNLERLTYTDGFDAFPMFSPDGKKLVWISGRNAKVPHETNVFIADWAP